MGYTDELRQFIDQFLIMATRARDSAVEKGEQNFAEWFGELVDKAAKLKAAAPKQ